MYVITFALEHRYLFASPQRPLDYRLPLQQPPRLKSDSKQNCRGAIRALCQHGALSGLQPLFGQSYVTGGVIVTVRGYWPRLSDVMGRVLARLDELQALSRQSKRLFCYRSESQETSAANFSSCDQG